MSASAPQGERTLSPTEMGYPEYNATQQALTELEGAHATIRRVGEVVSQTKTWLPGEVLIAIDKADLDLSACISRLRKAANGETA
jgi:hypothetical protein